MFEGNDFELDEIFSQPFESEQFTKNKRVHQNEPSPETNKRPCLNSTPNSFPSVSSTPEVKQTTLASSLPRQFSSNYQGFQSPQRKVVPRKFPGPAGLLPEYAHIEGNTKENKSEIEICSQIPTTILQEGAWEQMNREFCCTALSRGMFLPDKYNIAWIKAKMKSNELINQKAPFLAAVVQKIDSLKLKTPVVTIILKDTTGQIHGTIVNDLYEEYMNELKAGSVVVLKQFGVLVTDSGSNYYVTITANNLVAIYSEEESIVKVSTVQKLSAQELIKNIEEVGAKHRAGLIEQRRNVFLNLWPLSNGNLSSSRSSPMAPQALKESGSVRTETSLKSNAVISSKSDNVRTEINSVTPDANDRKRFNFKPVRTTGLVSVGANENMQPKININKGETSNKSSDSCSQVSVVSSNLEHSAILESIFDGVDADDLFDDF